MNENQEEQLSSGAEELSKERRHERGVLKDEEDEEEFTHKTGH